MYRFFLTHVHVLSIVLYFIFYFYLLTTRYNYAIMPRRKIIKKKAFNINYKYFGLVFQRQMTKKNKQYQGFFVRSALNILINSQENKEKKNNE